MWIDLPPVPLKQKVENYPNSGLNKVKKRAQILPSSVVLIECKDGYNSDSTSVYGIAKNLGVPAATTLSIQGGGIQPFLNALFIAQMHLNCDTTSVIIVTSSSRVVSAKNNFSSLQFVRLSLHRSQTVENSQVMIKSVNPVNVHRFMNNDCEAYPSKGGSISCNTHFAWLLCSADDCNPSSIPEIVSHQSIAARATNSNTQSPCHDLISKMSEKLDLVRTAKTCLLLVA